jgi:hypothetical protein
MHHWDLFKGDTRSLLAFLEIIGWDMRIAGEKPWEPGCRIIMRGAEIIVSWTNVKALSRARMWCD